MKFVLPVIHHLDNNTSIGQAILAFECGADGVFLISHKSEDKYLFWPSMEIKRRFPKKLVGLNLLQCDGRDAVTRVRLAGLDMVWMDDPGVSSKPLTGREMNFKKGHSARAESECDGPIVFGSVAFKYQGEEADPGAAAKNALSLGMLPTTSGIQTGTPLSVEKIKAMRKAIGGSAQLAIASGMTAENVGEYTGLATHFLVATGVSMDEHHFDREKLLAFVSKVKDVELESH